MDVYSTYSIFLSGKDEDLRQATALLRDTIIDQNCFSAFDSISEDDNSDDEYSTSIASDERFFEVVETSECVWLEDVESLAAELVALVPEITFSISGQIHDSTPKADDRMDFLVEYRKHSLTSSKSCWYRCIDMETFENYNSFCQNVCDHNGNPRYSEEDYNAFCDCAKIWYVLDGGSGEFSSSVSLSPPKRLKIKKRMD